MFQILFHQFGSPTNLKIFYLKELPLLEQIDALVYTYLEKTDRSRFSTLKRIVKATDNDDFAGSYICYFDFDFDVRSKNIYYQTEELELTEPPNMKSYLTHEFKSVRETAKQFLKGD